MDSALSAVLAAPDDDAPRLVYADWLQQRHDPRGELIAVQCALGARPGDAALRKREEELLAQHGEAWAAALEALGADGCVWHRGFIDEAFAEVRALSKNAAAIFELAPLLRRVETTLSTVAEARALAKLPQFGRLRSVRYGANRGTIRDRGLVHATFLAAVKAPELNELDAYSDVGAEAVKALVDNRALGGLTGLRLGGKLGVSATKALAGWAGLARLTQLDLSVAGLDDKAVAALMSSPHLGQLEVLCLTSNWIGEAGAKAILKAGLPRLRELRLGFQQGVAKGAKRVSSATNTALAARFAAFLPATAKLSTSAP
jgi:uncharacterized protein (TIGR02996 family)